MNPHEDMQLETAISRELKDLPEITAPASLLKRVMTTLDQRSRVRWYRRSWQTWPVPIQAASFLVLLAVFAGLCLAGWRVWHTDTIMLAMHRAGGWLSAIQTLWTTFNLVVSSAFVAAKTLGTGFLAACLAAAGLGYAVCVGLGTVYLRLAFAKR